MNSVANIWKHPKTTVAGVLIAIVSISGVLAQQGVTLGSAGTGTVVSLAGGLATALLGLLARDPESAPAAAGQAQKLGAWALIALLLPLPFLGGCTGKTVAQDIVNWTPALESAVATVDSTGALLAPLDGPIFTAATSGFDAASALLVTQAKAYLANSTASTLAQMQAQIVVLQQQVNAALLQAAHIINPASQQHALAAIQAVGAVVSTILSLVQSVSSKAAVAQMAAGSSIKLASVRPLLDENRAADAVAAHYAEPAGLARAQVAESEARQMEAGF